MKDPLILAILRRSQALYVVARRVLKLVHEGDIIMLWTIVVVLLVLWVLGIATSYTVGGLLHILLLAALVMAAIQLLSGRRTV